MTSYLPFRLAIECIDDAIVLGKRHYLSLFRLALIPFLAYVGVGYFLNTRAASLGLRVFATVVIYGIYGLLEAVTVLGAWDALHGRPIDVGATWRAVSQHVMSVLVANLIRTFLIFLGAMFFVLPGLYFVAIYFAVPAVNVIEGLGVGRSLVRSRALALGALRGILLSMGGLWLLTVIVAFLIPRVLTQLGVPPFSLIRTLCAFAWAGVIIPFHAALTARVYLEVLVRKEGYDLQSLMASLPSAASFTTP